MTAAFTLEEILTATQGRILTSIQAFPEMVNLSTDSRTVGAGQLFIPLSGERFNGHQFVSQALNQGAVGTLVNIDEWDTHPEWYKFPNMIAVRDPLHAYLALAQRHRQRVNPLVIAITGSSGKTTTKEMFYAALSRCGNTQKSEKNHNNEVGLCQTLLSLKPETEVVVVEMGMRGLNQIELLTRYAEPDMAVVTNVGPAHIGLLGSLEAIAQAKCEIFSGLDPEIGMGLVNGDDSLLVQTAHGVWKGELETYCLQDATEIENTAEGGMTFTYHSHRIRLAVPGMHMVSNALAVLKAGESLGFPLKPMIEGLEAFSPEGGRWNQQRLPGYPEVWAINDAYNANPDSVQASLDAFLTSPAYGKYRKILVLGGMKELGDKTSFYHRQLGQWLYKQANIEALWIVGEEAQELFEEASKGHFPCHFFSTMEELEGTFQSQQALEPGSMLFLKGSRAYQLEKLLESLSQESHAV